MSEEKLGLIIDVDKVRRLIIEKSIKKFSCGLINDASSTMGDSTDAAIWDGKDLGGGWVGSQTWGIPGIQDEDGILYPAYRAMTKADLGKGDKDD